MREARNRTSALKSGARGCEQYNLTVNKLLSFKEM